MGKIEVAEGQARQQAVRDLLETLAGVAGEVLPHVSDAWVDHERTKTGYEIPGSSRLRSG